MNGHSQLTRIATPCDLRSPARQPRQVGRKLAIVLAALVAGSAAAVMGARATAAETGAKGATIYASDCAMCHGEGLRDGAAPPLVGEAFVAKWRGAGTEGLARYIQVAMPPGVSQPIDRDTAHQVAAYILAANSARAAREEPRGDAVARSTRARLDTLASALSPVTDAMLRSPSSQDWLLWRGDAGAQGYSRLRQIDASNVGSLQLVWSRSLGKGTNGIAPLVHDGVMFVHGGGKISALDAASGSTIWAKDDPVSRSDISQPRGLALYGTSLFASTVDKKTMALDARTGAVLWETVVDAPGTMTAPPLAVGGRVFQGSSQCAFAGQRCQMTALDASTGRIIWQLKTVPGDGEPGSDTWGDAPAAQRGGAGIWSGPSYDFGAGQLLFGTGNTYAVETLLRRIPRKPSDGLYINSTLKVDAATGAMKWYFQHLAGDVWDMDASFERTMMIDPRGSGRQIVVTVGKIGIVDAIDLETGRYLWSIDLGEQDIVTRIDPRSGRKILNANRIPSPDRAASSCPFGEGLRNWQATSYDPERKLLFVPMTTNTCMETKLVAGQRFGAAWQLKTRAGASDFGGWAAIDLRTGKTAWRDLRRAPPASAQLATAGGIVFDGSIDRQFRARDSATGAVLWQAQLSDSPTSFPITFGVNGKQYVAIATGGGTYHDAVAHQLAPEIDPSLPQPTLWVFALP